MASGKTWTKERHAAYMREYYRRNPHQRRKQIEWANKQYRTNLKYRAEKLEDVKARGKRRWAADPEHRAKKTAARKQWRKDNPELWRAQNISQNNRRRARLLSAHTKKADKLIKKWKLEIDFICEYCARPFPTKGNLHIDHIEPLNRGGKHEVGNLARACGDCNLSKGTKTVEEFLDLW